METTYLTNALRAATGKRDFLEEALSNINRTLKTEYFDESGVDDTRGFDVLEGELNSYSKEIGTLHAIDNKITFLIENFSTLTDKALATALNEIEPTFTPGQMSLMTESIGTSMRGKATLACESMDKRVKMGIISLIIAALLKLISWLINFMKKSKRKGNKLKKSAKEKEREFRERMDKEYEKQYEEFSQKKYEFFTDKIRTEVSKVFDYASTGNARGNGANYHGSATNLLIAMLDYIDKLTVPVKKKEKLAEASINQIYTFISNNVAISWFAFNDASCSKVAKELVEFELRGLQPPFSPTISRLIGIVSDSPTVQHMWSDNDKWRNNEIRLLTKNSCSDFLIFCQNLECAISGMRGFFNGTEARAYLDATKKNPYGEANDSMLNYDTASRPAQSPFGLFFNSTINTTDEEVMNGLRDIIVAYAERTSISVNSSSRVSTPVKYEDFKITDYDTPHGPVKGVMPINTSFVQPSAYRGLETQLNSLGKLDALETIAELFYKMHGDYEYSDSIEKRLWVLSNDYDNDNSNCSGYLKRCKDDLNDIKVLMDQQAKSREGAKPGKDNIFIYDLPIVSSAIGLRYIEGGKMTNPKTDIKLGKYITDNVKLYQRAITGWMGYLNAIERAASLAADLEI